MATDTKYAALSSARIKSAFKDYGRLMASDVDGTLWLTNAYFAVPAVRHFSAMLKTYNLPEEPGIWDLSGKDAYLTSATPPNVAAILPADWSTAEKSEAWNEARPVHVRGCTNPVFASADVPAVILEADTDTVNPVTFGANWEYLKVILGAEDLHWNANAKEFGALVKRGRQPSQSYRVRIFAQRGKSTGHALVVIIEHETYISCQPGKGESGNVWLEDLRAVLMPVKVS